MGAGGLAPPEALLSVLENEMNKADVVEMQLRLEAAIANPGMCKTLNGAARKFKVKHGAVLHCGFCGNAVIASYYQTEKLRRWVPANFVYLPEGMMVGDEPCYLCLDCFSVNKGLLELTIQSLLAQVRSRSLRYGQEVKHALVEVVQAWCMTNLSVAGSAKAVHQAVTRQVELAGDDGKPAPAGATGERSDTAAMGANEVLIL